MEKKRQRLVRWLLSGLFMMAACIRSLAAQEDYVFTIVGEDASEIVTAGVAVVIDDNGSYFAIASMDLVDSSAEKYRIIDENGDSYDVDFTGRGFLEYGLGMFAFQEQVPPKTEIMGLSGGIQGQTADLLYLDSEGEIATCQIRLLEAQVGEPELLTLLGWELASEEGLDVLCFPLIVIDSQSELVGLMVETGELISFHTDIDAFYGQDGRENGSEEDAKEQETSEDSEREGRQTDTERETKAQKEEETIRENKRENKREKFGEDDPDDIERKHSGGDKKWFLLLGILGVAAAGVALVKIKAGSKEPPKPVPPKPEPLKPVLPKPEPPKPLPPVPVPPDPVQPAPSPAGASLIGNSGLMKGRIYPIGRQGISIGREVSCGIRFPEDTKGVSRNHCKLFWNEQGVLMIMDCGSSYGTYLTNYGKLSDHLPVPVKNGDMFCLGSEKNTFEVRY